VNRGYVFSSAFLSDEQAVEEFRRKNPKIGPDPRVVKFRTGRYQRCWVENVVAIGNSAGFVEPLEATALMIVCAQCQTLCNLLQQSRLEPPPTMRHFFNNFFAAGWDEIRDFLGLHYKLNTRIDNPFWRHCVHDTDLSAIQDLIEFYNENGPSLLCRQFLRTSSQSPFGADGFIVMFVGFQAPYSHMFHPSAAEKTIWENRRAALRAKGASGLSVKEALSYIHHPAWQWHGDLHPKGPSPDSIPSLGGMGLRA
jgi:tryptophan halogenase